jgi:hypothetical protein
MFQRFKDQYATEEDHEFMQIPRHALHAMGIKIKFHGEKRIFQTQIPKDLLEWMDNNLKIDSEKFQEISAKKITQILEAR